MLPTEPVLVLEFRVSRHTVRAALHHLDVRSAMFAPALRVSQTARVLAAAFSERLLHVHFGRCVDAPYVPSEALRR
jgi:hypothetical protein